MNEQANNQCFEPENPNIGAVGSWGHQDESDRVKGFYTSVITPQSLLALQKFNAQGMALTLELGASRTIGRAIIDNNALAEASFLPFTPEAIIPLSARWQSSSLCYFGQISPERTCSPETEKNLNHIVDNVLTSETLGAYWQAPYLLNNGFIIEQLHANLPPRDFNRLEEIYRQSFPAYLVDMKASAIRNMYATPEATAFGIRSNEGNLVAAISLELATISLGNRELRLAEMGDFATAQGHRRQGLNTFLRAHTLQYLLEVWDMDVVVVEANALSPGANKKNSCLGLEYFGRQPLNCLLAADPDSEVISRDTLPEGFQNFSPLNVWAQSADRLRQFIHPIGEPI